MVFRQSALPINSLLADKLIITSAPARADWVAGLIGANKSSQTSAATLAPFKSNSRSVPNGTFCLLS